MPEQRTKGQFEAALTEALTKFEREHLGRGPEVARTYIVQDMVLTRMKGILTPAEKKLSQKEGGIELIKEMRSRLIEDCAVNLRDIVSDELSVEVTTMHTDISARTGERVFVFGLAENLEEHLNGR